jgi:LPXTG-site transpeptidase (sortase) family protein
MLTRLINAFVQRFGTLLLVFGAVLFVLGALMQVARMRHMASAESEMPAFEESVEGAQGSLAGVEASELPGASESPGSVGESLDPVVDSAVDPAVVTGERVPSEDDASSGEEGAEGEAKAPAFSVVEELIAAERERIAAARATATPVIPERIRIPRVGIDTDIVEVGWESRIVNGENEGNVWQTADNAAGLHKGSARLGEPGNTVISGHNNIGGSVFRELHAVEKGDIVHLDAEGQSRAYVVEYKFVLWEEGATTERRKANARWIDSTPDERVTLVSCYPPWGNTHRVVVVARPLEGEPGAVAAPVAR